MTFMNQSDGKINVYHIPRGSAKTDPYIKSAMFIDDVKQVDKELFLKPRLNESIAKEIAHQFRKDGKRK